MQRGRSREERTHANTKTVVTLLLFSVPSILSNPLFDQVAVTKTSISRIRETFSPRFNNSMRESNYVISAIFSLKSSKFPTVIPVLTENIVG